MRTAPGARPRQVARLGRVVHIALLACLSPAGAAPRGDAVITAIEHGGAIDWTRGMIMAVGAAPGDIRAPSPDLARVGAERRARSQARERLLAAARALPVAGDAARTVGADADGAVAGRLAAAVERSLDLAVDYGSDGSVVLTAGLPLEAVRQAVRPAPPVEVSPAPSAPAAASTPITAVIVDARGVLDAPALGLGLIAGEQEHAGPAVFHPGTGVADARRGPRPVRTRATAVRDGRLVVDLPAPDLAAANAARALVIVIIGRS